VESLDEGEAITVSTFETRFAKDFGDILLCTGEEEKVVDKDNEEDGSSRIARATSSRTRFSITASKAAEASVSISFRKIGV